MSITYNFDRGTTTINPLIIIRSSRTAEILIYKRDPSDLNSFNLGTLGNILQYINISALLLD